MKQSIFVAFEGLDGSGKSTQSAYLSRMLRNNGFQVYETAEPTDGPIGSLIHQMMTGRVSGSHSAIAALFVADRLDHLLNDTNGILMKVRSGISVITDRYYFSSYAYHSVHVPIDWVIQANALSAQILRPDITIFLDVPPEECLTRITHERIHLELYENLDMMRQVRENYLRAFDLLQAGECVERIDASHAPEVISDEVWKHVSPLLKEGNCGSQ